MWLQLSILGFCENSFSIDVGAFLGTSAAQGRVAAPFLGLMTDNGKLADPEGGGTIGALGGWSRGCRGSLQPSSQDTGSVLETAWRRSWKDRRETWELCLVGSRRAAVTVTMVTGSGCHLWCTHGREVLVSFPPGLRLRTCADLLEVPAGRAGPLGLSACEACVLHAGALRLFEESCIPPVLLPGAWPLQPMGLSAGRLLSAHLQDGRGVPPAPFESQDPVS